QIDQNKINEGLKVFLSNYIPPLTLHDDCLPTIRKLKAEGFRMGIATNGAHDVQPRTIEKFDLGQYFDFVAISSEVKASKDTKKYVHYLIDNFGIIPEDTLIVGDTLPDFLLAKGLESMVYIVDRSQRMPSSSYQSIANPNKSEQQYLSGKLRQDEIPCDIIIPTLSIIPEILKKGI
ncbi:HAD family hydrolase, partial [bacterium]|nr:HAD family hydrolase [bacterium]